MRTLRHLDATRTRQHDAGSRIAWCRTGVGPAGFTEEIDAKAGNPVELPSGQKFYRRWQVNALKGRTAVELRFSFVPGFGEYTIQARGSLASATVDFDRDTYSLRRHRPLSDDFDRYAIVADSARNARRQARRTLINYALSKFYPSFKRHPLRGDASPTP